MCTQHSLLLWRVRQDRASQASKGPLFCVIEGRTNVLRRQRDCYGEASSAAASGVVLCGATVEVEVGGFLFFKTGTV